MLSALVSVCVPVLTSLDDGLEIESVSQTLFSPVLLLVGVFIIATK